MKLDLSEIARTPGMHATQEIDEACPEDLGARVLSNVVGRVDIVNTGSLLVVQGALKAEVGFECSRCLEDFAMSLEAPVQEAFRIEIVGDAAQVLPVEEDDAASPFVENNILDLHEIVRQSLLVVMPIQPLCRSECKGLCVACGQNLNVRECNCRPAEEESPFSILADLMKEQGDDMGS